MNDHEKILKSRREQIIDNDPNGLVVVNDNLEIVQINPAFLKIFDVNISEVGMVVGCNVNEIIGQEFFPSPDILSECRTIKHHKRTGKVIQLVSFKLDEEGLSACFFVDVTLHVHSKQRVVALKKDTLEKARQIIDKQMRVAQEIASLLGETTAETKVIFLKLREIMKDENGISE
ncbi:MAG: PAS domain-containing protein [Candidatus Cloacimonetes bacterium]|nr:PAS domain-containing protein [Candidatus Cloacimonadota bacterium]